MTMTATEREHSQGSEQQARNDMNRMYRFTRHVYDLSRKYYLLGRDRLIESLNAQDGERICEVGCGTARNLIKMAKRYPGAKFFGLDASDVMLETAQESLDRARLANPVRIAQGFSQSFDPGSLFDLKDTLDKIVFSYSLSIIPPWKESIDHALELLPPGGTIHIVDFGGQEELPRWFRAFLFWWLKLFHVYHKPEILAYLRELETSGAGSLRVETLYGGYTYLAKFEKSA